MTPDEVAEIFTTATAEYVSVTSKPTFTDIEKFDQKVNSILVEIPRDHDGDEYGMLYLSQNPSDYRNLTGGSTLTKIGTLPAHDNSIDLTSSSDAERKKAEVLWKVKLNDSKVEAAAERGAKKMLLNTFDDTHTNKLKHAVKLYAGVSYYQLIDHLRSTYRKLHHLNISELLKEMSSYFDINDGFARYIERMKEAQKIADTVDVNLITDATLLRMGIEAMHDCGLFEKALDEWEELDTAHQNWDEFQTHFQDAEEKYNLKKKIHDKKGNIGQAHAVSTEASPQFDMDNMNTYLDNLAAAATQEKNVLDQLVANNTKLVQQLEVLTKKYESLKNNSSNSQEPAINGKKMKFVQYEKNGYCHTHGFRITNGHSSKTCSKPGPSHDREATRNDTRGGSTKNKDWVCSHYEEKGFWVPEERS